jgi:hypothetical protein
MSKEVQSSITGNRHLKFAFFKMNTGHRKTNLTEFNPEHQEFIEGESPDFLLLQRPEKQAPLRKNSSSERRRHGPLFYKDKGCPGDCTELLRSRVPGENPED